MAGPLAADVKEAERSVMRSCIEEAFWRRSLPAALLTLPPVSLYLYRQGGTTRYLGCALNSKPFHKGTLC